MRSEIVVIGGGASGLMAAYHAARTLVDAGAAAQVTVLEKMPRPARKIMITGKGRCNFTNLKDWNAFSGHIRSKPNFVKSAFYNLPSQAVFDWFEGFGMPAVVERGDRAFPASYHASDVVDTLVNACLSLGVKIETEAEVASINPSPFGSSPLKTSGCAGPLPSDDGPLPLNVPRVAVFPEAAAASPAAECNNYCEDAIEFLRKTPEGKYDLMIVDPPAFAKHRGALQNALRAYQRLNAAAIAKVAPGGLVFTFSCSQVVDKITFANTVFSAAAQTGRSVRILDRLCQGSDHPVSIYHPEGEYLKGLLLYVE